ncbi:restriction endonuclease [Actinomadura sp. CNU-125]|uniref:Eco57I restriction-modification methylase domain-containing protein n=1 Tax=Actinomadura sp. CNU-125 TaxID=1904961 RepID=UPI000960CCD1|nr:DNA methyltransferase [Actinomadura sp. CNU-125]OLT28357.1 restriction endonuclease [Actinomadura sp. CNU-125]
MSRSTTTLPLGVATVGGLLPEETLLRIASGNKDLPGAKPAAYHLAKDETVTDVAERSWTYLRGRYAAFKEQLTEDDPAVGITREYWLGRLFQELGFGYVPRTPSGGLTSDDGEKQFAISHQWQHVPVHQLGWGVPLDRRSKGIPGAADAAPQSLVQEYLNRSAASLWGIATNGRLLRILRDSSALASSAYVEFDLEAIFEGEAFDAFVLLYRVAHSSRFELHGEDAGPASCWLEKWRQEAIDSGARVLDQLRVTVKEAIETLGTGFIQHPDNENLRAALRDRDNKAVTPETLHRALLRTVYRLLFLFVAEDRDVLLDPSAPQPARDRYTEYFSTDKLRRIAARRHGGRHDDQWQAVTLVLDGLGQESGRPELGLPALGGIFELSGADHALHGLSLVNEHLLTAVRSLSRVQDQKARRVRRVDFKHLGSEELGSVYESLLEYVPKYDPAKGAFELRQLSGNDRKTSGSYYTPASLIDTLLDSALDPVIDDAVKNGGDTPEEQEKALLKLTVCDPACGSGHFLVAAARRIAKRLAFVRTGDPEPSIESVRHALREVVANCIYGVDLNPMAVELAKVSLWLEALEPGKALSFLDAHIKVGNALLGTTPKLLDAGLPDDAFKAIEGDDKKWVTALKKRNKTEREAYEKRHIGVQGELFEDARMCAGNEGLARRVTAITNAQSDHLTQVHAQQAAFQEMQKSSEYLGQKDLYDAWCAAFVWTKTEGQDAITTRTLEKLHQAPTALAERMRDDLRKLAKQYRFFHWHLEFPSVFNVPDDENAPGIDPRTGWAGGFSCVLGNPPWERIKLQEQEFFATRDEEIAKAPNKAARTNLIEALKEENPDLYAAFGKAKRQAEFESHFLRMAGRYPLTGRGDINTYAVFSEHDRTVLGPRGRLGIIVPTGIATDATTQHFFRDVVESRSLASLYDFENRALLFRDVDSRFKFVLLTLAGRKEREAKADFAFFLHDPAELETPLKRFTLTPEEITLINPNTSTCPVFRSRRDAEITLGIYRRVPVLLKEGDPNGNPWGVSFMTMFHMSNDSHLFKTREELEEDGWRLEGNVFTRGEQRYLPLYEAKMLHHYDHRWATYEADGSVRDVTPAEKQDPSFAVLPRYWVPEHDVPGNKRDKQGKPIRESGVMSRLSGKGWNRRWLLGWRDICRATDERTAISFIFPLAGVGNKIPIMLSECSTEELAALQACLSSFVLDFSSRQKIGGTTMNFFIWQQLPVLSPAFLGQAFWDRECGVSRWVSRRVMELNHAATDIRGFAGEIGYDGAPLKWDVERRRLLRAELDAAFFHLYGIERDDVDYIMETFPIVKKKDVAVFGSYRTKELILEVYDAMTQAIRTGEPYKTILDPPPGQGPRHSAPSPLP